MTNRSTIALVALAMFALVAAMVAPVMAGASDTTAVSGNPSTYVDLTISAATVSMTLTPGQTMHDTSTHLDVASNCPTIIQAKDAMTNSKPSAGFMVNVTTAGNTYSADKLGTAMGISGTVAGVFSTSSISPLTADLATLYTGSGETAPQQLALSFDQIVSVTDPHLPTDYSYRIPVTFTITAT